MNKKLVFLFLITAFVSLPIASLAQTDNASESVSEIKPLRSDVGIIGLTANFKFLDDFTYLGTDTLRSDSNTELEFVFRDVRTVSRQLGVGFQVLTSIFFDDFSNFGIGSWGLGPVIRGYPLKTNKWQPYVEADMLFGNNMGVGDLSDSQTGGDGFRIRLGLSGGLAYRINNGLGLFVEFGPNWESSTFFKSDARTFQLNIGFDLYRFN